MVLHALLTATPQGPVIAESQSQQDAESLAETTTVQAALQNCGSGQAVELALGPENHSAFLLNPITLPPGVSLIIDGGVTVYATRTPANYQVAGSEYICGTTKVGNPVNGECQAFITLAENSGIYGYGILDGQGSQPLFIEPQTTPPTTWWSLITDKKGCSGCQEESPLMISAGNIKGKRSTNSNFAFYKFTIRNPQYHIVDLGGTNHTVWGVKIQAPWIVPNTDGFDVHASNVTIYDTVVANGDQEIAFSATPTVATQKLPSTAFTATARAASRFS
ncbi:hypothetical protein YK56LOC_38510 [Caballeronia sp. HLA56]